MIVHPRFHWEKSRWNREFFEIFITYYNLIKQKTI